MSYTISEVRSNYVIVDGKPDFSKGLLFPHNILFRGEAVSLPFALNLMDRLREEKELVGKCTILSRFGADAKNVLLALDFENFLENTIHLENNLKENKVYTGTVLAQCYGTTVVSVDGHFGYIEGIITAQVDDKISVSLVDKSSSKLNFCRFAEVVQADSTCEETDDNVLSIEEFLNKDELSAISPEESQTVEWLLENVNGINRQNINVIREPLHISYRQSVQSELHHFLSLHPHYFEENNFWVGGYKESDVGNVKLIIYDANNVVLAVLVNQMGIWVSEFSHDKIKSNAQFLMDRNQRAIILPGSLIHIHENNYVRDDYMEVGERVINQYLVAKMILPHLQKEVKVQKEKAGVDYLILRDLIAFQEQKERKEQADCVVDVPADYAHVTTSVGGDDSSAIAISRMELVSHLFNEKDSDACYVELCRGEEKLNAMLKEDIDHQCYVIDFYNTHRSLVEWCHSGFKIRRRASLKHLKLQQEAINDFVYGRNQSYIFSRLKQGELEIPEPVGEITFFDEKFNCVEEGNNQPSAIRKAVGNQDVLLIQGPPGTGKTSVIVEIIKQLVLNKNERVLVCSQAHSAVKNIYDRLKDADERLKIGNIDVEETMQTDDIMEHPVFIKNNMSLLNRLSEASTDFSGVASAYERMVASDYTSSSKTHFLKEHQLLGQYYEENKPDNLSAYNDILDQLRRGLLELGDDAVAFNNARHYQSLNVVMGTCIGIGLDYGLRQSGILFDTVIIDEAGKANLAETAVPMQLGKKYILVGDQRQLPPYMDKEEVASFREESATLELSQKEVESAISYSLFEDFLHDEHFPKESVVLLNYQYRMNPEIGDYVSELFYEGELKNGRGTESQRCNLDGFPDSVTFIDTSTYETYKDVNVAYESQDDAGGYYNLREIGIFRERILPKLLRLKGNSPEISVGVITPYRRQRQRLLAELRGTALENRVYTIDSIQGTEFDVVVVSLVRAFNPRSHQTVGFLDDMRRLNVALSRAKRKLIIIGNLDTLCSEYAHTEWYSSIELRPVEVFCKLREIKDRTVKKTSLAILKEAMDRGEVYPGYLFKDCSWIINDRNSLIVRITLNGDSYSFPIKKTELFERYGQIEKTVDIRFLGLGENGHALFEFIPSVSISEQIEDGAKQKFMATPIKWLDDDSDEVLLRLQDSSEIALMVNTRLYKTDLLYALLSSLEVKDLNLFCQPDGSVDMDVSSYRRFKESHSEGDEVELLVVDDSEANDYYIVRYGNDVYGKVYKRYSSPLVKGQIAVGQVRNLYGRNAVFEVKK